MSGFARDLGQAVRHAIRRPVSSLVVILTFALGIGASTALFSVAKAVWIDTVPYATASRAVQLFVGIEGETSRYGPNVPEVLDLRADPNSPLKVSAVTTQVGGMYRLQPEGLPFFTLGADAELFTIFPETPLLGRRISVADQRDEAPVAMATELFWRRWLGSDPSVIGKTLTLAPNQGEIESVTIVGVLPARFAPFSRGFGLVRPLRRSDLSMERGNHGQETVYGLLGEGRSLRAARDRLAEIGREWPAPAGTSRRLRLSADPVRSVIAGPGVAGALAALAGVALLVLLIASANVANLLIAAGSDRARELAIRASLGASRGRLARQLLAESLLLASAGSAAAVVLFWWTRDALVALVPLSVYGTERIGINPGVLAFTLAVTAATASAAALWPALHLSRAAPGTLMASQWRAGRQRGISTWLLAAQAAAGVMVVVAGVLLARSFVHLASVDPGFDSEGAVIVSTRRTQPSGPVDLNALLESIRALPMVEAAGATESIPMSGSRSRFSARPAEAPRTAAQLVDLRRISPGYFEALGMRMLRGRPFLPTDTKGAESVAILNNHAARSLFAGADPLQRKLNIGAGPATVIGIVADVRHMGLDRTSVPEVFRPHEQHPMGGVTLAVRGRANAAGLAHALRSLDTAPHGVTLHDIRSGRENVGRSLREPWFRTVLFGVMAGLVLILTVLGVAALAAHAVIRRRREIGVRMAIGSTPSQAVMLLVRQALGPSAAGAALGLIGAWWATRVIGKFLFSVDARDLPSFGGAAALMLAGAAIAAWLPARRAARIDPVIALRVE